MAAVPKQTQEISRVFPARDQQNLMDPSVNKGLNRVIHHGLVVHRQQVLIGHPGERVQAAASAAGQDYAFHMSPSLLDDQFKLFVNLPTASEPCNQQGRLGLPAFPALGWVGQG